MFLKKTLFFLNAFLVSPRAITTGETGTLGQSQVVSQQTISRELACGSRVGSLGRAARLGHECTHRWSFWQYCVSYNRYIVDTYVYYINSVYIYIEIFTK